MTDQTLEDRVQELSIEVAQVRRALMNLGAAVLAGGKADASAAYLVWHENELNPPVPAPVPSAPPADTTPPVTPPVSPPVSPVVVAPVSIPPVTIPPGPENSSAPTSQQSAPGNVGTAAGSTEESKPA